MKLFRSDCFFQLNLKMNLCIVNALWYLLVGESLELEDEKMKNLLQNFDTVLRSNKRPSKTIQLLGKIHPSFIKWFDKEFKLFRKVFDQTENLIRPYINEHKASLNPNELRDFMDAYLNEVSKTGDKKSSFFGKRGEESLIATITDLFFAGTGKYRVSNHKPAESRYLFARIIA